LIKIIIAGDLEGKVRGSKIRSTFCERERKEEQQVAETDLSSVSVENQNATFGSSGEYQASIRGELRASRTPDGGS